MSQVFAGKAPGFDIREIANPKDHKRIAVKGKNKVLITFATNDAEAPPDQARYLIKLFDASYMVGDGNTLNPKLKDGHSFWITRLYKGLTADLQNKMILNAPELQTMLVTDQNTPCVNEYFSVPVPESHSLEMQMKKK